MIHKPAQISRFPLIIATLSLVLSVFTTGCDMRHDAKTGDPAPEISGRDIGGAPVSLGKLKGKVVVLCFWTNSCCGERLKELEPYYRRVKDKGLAILAVNEGNTRENVESWVKTNGVTFTALTDEGGTAAKDYGVFGFPTLFVIDKEGTIQKKILGVIDAAQIDKVVAQNNR